MVDGFSRTAIGLSLTSSTMSLPRRAFGLGKRQLARVKYRYLWVNRQLYRRFFADKYLSSIKRGTRNSCWCGGNLAPFRWLSSYGVCERCGCFVNRCPPLRGEFARVYSFNLYWHVKQKADGLPIIEKRADRYVEDGRVDYWLGLIEKYRPSKGDVVEIGCAPGVLLRELKARGYDCLGVEPDEETVAWISKTMGVTMRAGLFPRVELPPCDLFLAFDVLEHVSEPEAFMREAARLLRPGGRAIIQTAIDRYDYVPPFAPRFRDAFDDIEHMFVFTNKSMDKLAERARLKILDNSDRLTLMGEICVFAKS